MSPVLLWTAFIVLVLPLLAPDLGVFHRKPTVPSVGEALAWTAFWISLALAFNAAIYYYNEELPLDVGQLSGSQAALQFLTGYIIEKSLIQRFDWVVYVFGVLLLVTAVKLPVDRHDNLQLERSPLMRLARRFCPVSDELHGSRFFVRVAGVWTMTRLFLALLVVEASDVVFAILGLRILDMGRSVLNVTGDLTTACFLARSEGYPLGGDAPEGQRS